MSPAPIDPDVANDDRYDFDWEEHNRLQAEKKAAQKATSFWNDEREAELRRLWVLDITASVIGKSLGCTRMAVIGKANRLGLPARDPKAFLQPFPKAKKGVRRFWTESKDDLLRAMWNDRLTATDIGAVLGVTPTAVRKRAAIIGLVRRDPDWYRVKMAA